MMRNNTVLITGVNGFIGSHIASLLVRIGYKVTGVALDDRFNWRIENLDIPIHYIDITNKAQVDFLIQHIQPQFVIHTAAMVDTSRDIGITPELIRINLIGTVNLLQACVKSGCALVINTGSSDEYGGNTAPFDEHMREMPTSPYGTCKLATTQFARMFAQSTATNVVTVRPFLVYGEMQAGSMLIPSLMKAAIERKPLQLTPGEQTRDPIHVEDVARGYLAIMENREKFEMGDVVNLACGEEHMVRDIARTIFQMTNAPEEFLQFGAKPYRDDEPMRFFASIEKMTELTGWRPSVDLRTGLERTFNWIREHEAK